MSLANRNRKKEERHTFKDSFPSRGVQKIHQPAKPDPTQPNPTRRVGSVFKAWWVGLGWVTKKFLIVDQVSLGHKISNPPNSA